MPESARRATASVLQWGSWMGAVFLLIWAPLTYNPSKGHFAPQWVSLTFILLIGIAIAATTARSRMRLSDTIVSAMQVGFDASKGEDE